VEQIPILGKFSASMRWLISMLPKMFAVIPDMTVLLKWKCPPMGGLCAVLDPGHA
jgi:hypothetical protein